MQQRQQHRQSNKSQLNFTITGHKSFLLFLLLVYVSRDGSAENAPAAADTVNDIHGKTVKKELKEKPEPIDTPIVAAPVAAAHMNDDEAKKQQQQNSDVIVISESTLAELQAAKETQKQKKKSEIITDSTDAAHIIDVKGQMHVEESSFKISHPDMGISESYKTGFYFFLGLSSAGIALIMYKIFRMRLSRAERKYGVQGDRSTQELTPLPVSIEDGNSDEEDQTLFEINRQQLRIL